MESLLTSRFSFLAFLAVLVALVGAWAAPAAAQGCHDWDGDRENGGLECDGATDCDDGLWDVRPGVAEICDGIDTDCDGAIDETCDRYCDTPDEYDVPRILEFGDLYPLGYLYVAECATFFPGGLLAVTETGPEGTEPLKARAFDGHGQPVAEPELIDVFPREGSALGVSGCSLFTGGAHHLILWTRGFVAPTPSRIMARVVDRFGAPVGPALDILELSGIEQYWSGTSRWSAPFNGDEFAVFWIRGGGHSNELLMTTVPYDGAPGGVRTVLVTDDIDGNRSGIGDVRSVWTGDRYIVVLSAGNNAELHAMAVGRDGTILSGPRSHGPGSMPTQMTMDDQGPVVIWIEDHPGNSLVHLLRLDPITGAVRANGPGSLVLPTSEALPQPSARTTWNGELLGVLATSSLWNGTTYEKAVWFWRVLSDGTLLDPLGIKLDDGENWRDPGVAGLGWNGRSFQFINKFANMKLARATIVCDCGDADGDQFVACGNDCDDGDPLVNGLATEVCTGGVDDDCDDLVDCADPDCTGGEGPPAVQDLVWSGNALAWSAGAGAQRWDVARGLLRDALRRGDFELAECVGWERTETTWPDDGRLPPVGDALWYLVRPEGEPCARGPWSADGTPRTTLVCD